MNQSLSRILLYVIIAFGISVCSEKPKVKNYQYGLPMKQMDFDTDKNNKKETMSYYIDDPGNFRTVYGEMDMDNDGASEIMFWTGLQTASPPGQAEKAFTKVHEEEDTNKNGKVDILRWMLPNQFIALAQVDSNEDGYFETTQYFNFKKNVVRTEIDSNFDGKSDIYFWKNRGEADTDFDGIPDAFIVLTSELELKEKIKLKKDLKPLKKEDSWFYNQSLIPQDERAIIGSGYF